ncbi:hypothetical protein EOA27_13680 [Mesorhizobium sp. M2A.F.Ca.ET.037.01.1.1]|uniref:hypothetical protein n=1 Tax=unclassified Mesorhizobium TaxID=325217 RepID=UPI000FCC8F66|nr:MULTISPECIES: hypothetical protein [unclassified Mesorhizobium]RUX18497.1 hypothetical protein EOA27_13680 [Mesorhizobium sp. M2A.F.Ca.ET.037.01.1.1]RUY11252.1 hypothetical protein EOA25_06450 [Mesorhizobium sp. M2A.F.Ca.ET.040.01.1.1]RWA91623.1 MAG: hypothetical protein EOQ31_10940 [Mesorhizobium sp.]TIV14892.1 MAG: hypothetical protein E5V95_28630 [Mesorhizobium sp.]
MNLSEAEAALQKVREALAAAWANEQSPARRSRLRAVILKTDREMASVTERMLVNNAAQYVPLQNNFQTAVKDLNWIRNQVESFAVSAGQAAQIVAWVASILPLL